MRALTLAFVLGLSLAACQSPPSPGAACSRAADCAAPLACAYGRCRAQCAENRDCPIGSECLLTAPGIGACALPTRDMCDLVSIPCAVGLACTGTVCRQTCDTLPCSAGSTCTSSAAGLVCVATDQDAGPPIDAGTDAAQPPTADSGPTGGAMRLGAGQSHFCAAMANGTLYCWGSSASYELGDRQVMHGDCLGCSPQPVQVLDRHLQPLTGVSAVSGGPAYTCAVVSGQVQCWGEGAVGNVAGSSLDPVTLTNTSGATLEGATQIVGALEHACALVGASDDVWCWGANGDGRLGDGTTTSTPFAVRATELGSMPRALAASQHHTIVLDAMGGMRGVGGNNSLELGVVGGPAYMAVVPTSFPHARALATSGGVTCIVREDTNALGCVGNANGGGLIEPMTVGCPDGTCSIVLHDMAITGAAERPMSVALTNAYFGTAGVAACVVGDMGNVYCVGTPAFAGSPTELTQVSGLSSVDEIVSSDSAFCARTHAGEVWCWGDDVNGQLGRGTHDTGADRVPQRVMLPQ